MVAAGSHQPSATCRRSWAWARWRRSAGRGIGSAVTALLAEDARASGATLLVLSAADERVARLYERLGFRRVGTACFGRAA